MSLASERREAELERANYAKAVKAMRASGGTFSGGSQPGTFKTPDGKTVTNAQSSGVYDMASLKREAKKAGTGGVNVTVNGVPMTYYDESVRNNPGIPTNAWTSGGKESGFVDQQIMRAAHPDTPDWVEQYGPLIVGGIAGAGLLAGGALAGGAAGGGAAAGDVAGLTQMGQAAGLSGDALNAFVASGGTAGSTAAGGALGVGTGAASGLTGDALGLQQMGQAAGLEGNALQQFVSSGGTLGSTVAGGGGIGTGAAGGISSLLGQAGSTLSGLMPSGNGGTGNLLGSLLPAGLGYLGASSQADAMKDIYNQTRADRMPALNAYNTALQNPNTFYQSAPAMGAVDAVLRKLSVGGNPAANPGSLSQAAAYNLGGYNDYLRGLTPAAFGTANTEANISMQGAGADAGKYNAVGWGLNQFMNPQPDYTQSLNKLALAIGGMKV